MVSPPSFDIVEVIILWPAWGHKVIVESLGGCH